MMDSTGGRVRTLLTRVLFPQRRATCTTQVTQFHDLNNLFPSWSIKCKLYAGTWFSSSDPDFQNEIPFPQHHADSLLAYCLWSS
ncbi:hypothetical protein SCLCIDRAFT_1215853 [Scleroderma citrinum Foug A]|uniref:Uncharacterized protein n=1 Tax=Scleroderma citrinum Foug A TaxID=1036808 RepID=A0A0C2ZJ37_9AGAM|nr:hypothetical protein SCLCIDRAFT_1215853 [Scleroderma citrinum Foug A]